MLSIHQNNETQYKIEINRYREKLAKYKQRIKEKDVVIGKLLEKLERKIQLDSGGLQNLLIKLH